MRQLSLAALLAAFAAAAFAQYPVRSLGVGIQGGPAGGYRAIAVPGSPGFPGYVASAGVVAPAFIGRPAVAAPFFYGPRYYPLPRTVYGYPGVYPVYVPAWRAPYFRFRGPVYYHAPLRGPGWIRWR